MSPTAEVKSRIVCHGTGISRTGESFFHLGSFFENEIMHLPKRDYLFSISAALVLLVGLGTFPWSGSSQGLQRPGSAEAAANVGTARYSKWQSALSKYVDKQGNVNYSNWKLDASALDQFLASLSGITRAEYDSMSRNEQMALWINAYNAFTVHLVLEHYPIHRSGLNLYPDSSIRQIDGVWKKYKLSVAGRTVSLHEIENEILRKQFKEPLIHFAINCASRSCPPLSNEAYSAVDLTKQLERAASTFIQSERFNKIEPTRKKVALSKIFDWYGEDFVSRYHGKQMEKRSQAQSAVISFIADHVGGSERAFLLSNDFALSYMNYDWALNESTGAN